ncbi:uncharacterized protein LOC129756026 [Uranotaenia lowii]|uniref:uncharacterized protein LOC129756026 n=1 Tax=Uranotaenia lowii TaxID=190385 RepID=UPI002479646C|nr:uncharacterized protein LOC129756026 [Uranotaenia lowii]
MELQRILPLLVVVLINFTSGCNVPTQHYKTMNCNPVGTKSTSGCPVRYDCPALTNRDNSKCYFNGKIYELNEQVPHNESAQLCSALCYCRSGNPFAQFRCTHIDCPEFFQKFDHENCIRKYQSKSCCAAGKVCGKERQELSKCTMDGEEYLEWEKMRPANNKCRTCICHKNYKESNIENDPNCYDTICGFELFYAKQVYGGAAPVYYEDRCCPWEWRMPRETDKVIGTGKSAGAPQDPKMQCKYGNLTLNIGDKLETEITDQFTVQCSCEIPPLVQCAQSKNTPV